MSEKEQTINTQPITKVIEAFDFGNGFMEAAFVHKGRAYREVVPAMSGTDLEAILPELACNLPIDDNGRVIFPKSTLQL